MDLELGNLKDAEARLDALEVERLDVQGRLREAIEAGDAEQIIELERRARALEVLLFAARAKVLRLRRADIERQRREVITLRAALEGELVEATRLYVDAVALCEDRRVVMQTIQARDFGLQSRIDQLREDLNDTNSELKSLVNSRIGKGE